MNQVADNFNSVEHYPLRTFNRAAMAFNLREDAGEHACQEYLDQFVDADKKALSIMFHYIKGMGVTAVRAAVMKGLKFTDE